jgi:hypothetical protein
MKPIKQEGDKMKKKTTKHIQTTKEKGASMKCSIKNKNRLETLAVVGLMFIVPLFSSLKHGESTNGRKLWQRNS